MQKAHHQLCVTAHSRFPFSSERAQLILEVRSYIVHKGACDNVKRDPGPSVATPRTQQLGRDKLAGAHSAAGYDMYVE